MKKWIGDGINSNLKDSSSNNVLNVVRALVEDSKSIVYIPNEYEKESNYNYTKDPRVHFYPVDSGKKIQVTGLKSNQERFNFSMIGLVDVLVEFPNDDGTVELRDMRVWRQYNIIRDGKLVIDHICAKLSEESFNSLRNIGILYYNGVIVPNNHQYKSDYIYKIVLKDLPLISYNWAQPIRIGLYINMKREEDIKSEISILKGIRKEYISSGMSIPVKSNKSNIYIENNTELVKSTRDKKEVDCVIYSISNISEDYNENLSEVFKDIESVDNRISILNKELSYIRFINRCIVYAIELSKNKGSYNWSELENVPRSKNKMRQTTKINVPDIGEIELVRTVYKKLV